MKLKLAAHWAARAKLYAEGAKLWAEGAKLWAEKILEIEGNITLEWKWRDGGYDYLLGTGELYKWDEVEE